MLSGMGDNLMSSAEACELLEVHRSTLVRWVQGGHLEAVMKLPGANGAYLFDRQRIEALHASRVAA